MFCEECGTENEKGGLFCKNCGNEIRTKEDKKYFEALEQLKEQGFEILNNSDNIGVNKGLLDVNKPNPEESKYIKNNIEKVEHQKMIKQSNSNKMGEVHIDSNLKKKSMVPIVICIATLIILIIGGIFGLAYYYLFGI